MDTVQSPVRARFTWAGRPRHDYRYRIRVGSTSLRGEIDRSKLASTTDLVDERPVFLDESLNLSPTGHEHLKLIPCCFCVGACEVDHPCPAVAHGIDLGAFGLDMTIARHDEPTRIGRNRNPVRVLRRGVSYWAGGAKEILHSPAGVPRVSAVVALLANEPGQTEYVSVEVDANYGRPRLAHAAALAISYANAH